MCQRDVLFRWSVLEESPEVFEKYRETPSYYNKGPRKAGKPGLVKGIINSYLTGVQLDKTCVI